MPQEKASPVQVLLVEDNPGDIRLMQEAFRECAHDYELSIVRDGEQALAYLRREGEYAQAPRPDLVILDLNLPRVDGQQVLSEVKADSRLRDIPVLVMTTSPQLAEVQRSYEAHANSYLVKPADLDEFFAVVQDIQRLWLDQIRNAAAD